MSVDPIKVTKTVYTVSDFLEWQRDGALELRPYFQRGSVWKGAAKSFLIDTVIRGYPIPVIHLQNKSVNGRRIRQVVDGQQRLRTLLAFIDPSSLGKLEPSDTFTLLKTHSPEFAGMDFASLPMGVQDRILETELSVHVLPPKISDSLLLQLFARLNSTGEKLNDQELRNARFHGAFKSTAYTLAYGQVDRWLSWGIFNRRQLAQMREVELVSELMLLLQRGIGAKSKVVLDNAYRDQDGDVTSGEIVIARFEAVMDELDALFSELPEAKERLSGQSWFYPLFALLVATKYENSLNGSRVDGGVDRTYTSKQVRTAVSRSVQRLSLSQDLDAELLKALRGASTDTKSRRTRLNLFVEELASS